jgi:hypothetical protein
MREPTNVSKDKKRASKNKKIKVWKHQQKEGKQKAEKYDGMLLRRRRIAERQEGCEKER